jgi:threonine dehydrogenase-like Zn-dependent dehydrogenase
MAAWRSAMGERANAGPKDLMRVLVLRDFGDLVLTELPKPVPRPGEVRVRVTATGVCGSDLHGYTGENGRRSPGQIMGHETYGVIDAAGDPGTASGLPVGAAVAMNPVVACGVCASCAQAWQQHCAVKQVIGVHKELPGSFAEYVVMPARNAVRIADGLPAGYGALIEPLAVGYHAVARAGLSAADRLLVLGGGPIGQAVILSARRAGVSEIVVSETDRGRRELCRLLGAVPVDPSDGELAGQVGEVFGSATAAIDAVGISATVRGALTATCLGARIVLVGMGSITLDVGAFDISVGERDLMGSFTYTAAEFGQVADWVSGQPDGLGHLLAPPASLASGPDVFRAMADGEMAAGKVPLFS